MVRYERTHSPERPDAAVVAAPHHHPPTGHLAGGRVSPSPRLRSRGGECHRPGLRCPGRGALVGGDQRLHGAGHRHSVRCPRQPAGGGRFCHRSKCARSDDSLGRRPCDDPGSGYSLLGIPVVFHRHRPDRCRLQPSGAACAPPATGWKRGISPPPQTNSLAGGGAVSLFWQYFIPYPKYPAYASEVFLAGYLLLACRF